MIQLDKKLIPKIQRLVTKYAKDGGSFGFIFPDGQTIYFKDSHDVVALDVSRRLKIHTGGYDGFFELGILRTGFHSREYYVQGNPPTSAQKEAIIDDIVGHRGIEFVSLQFSDKKWKYETGFKRWLANHTGIRVL